MGLFASVLLFLWFVGWFIAIRKAVANIVRYPIASFFIYLIGFIVIEKVGVQAIIGAIFVLALGFVLALWWPSRTIRVTTDVIRHRPIHVTAEELEQRRQTALTRQRELDLLVQEGKLAEAFRMSRAWGLPLPAGVREEITRLGIGHVRIYREQPGLQPEREGDRQVWDRFGADRSRPPRLAPQKERRAIIEDLERQGRLEEAFALRRRWKMDGPNG